VIPSDSLNGSVSKRLSALFAWRRKLELHASRSVSRTLSKSFRGRIALFGISGLGPTKTLCLSAERSAPPRPGSVLVTLSNPVSAAQVRAFDARLFSSTPSGVVRTIRSDCG